MKKYIIINLLIFAISLATLEASSKTVTFSDSSESFEYEQEESLEEFEARQDQYLEDLKGINPSKLDDEDEKGRTLLHLAVQLGYAKVVEYLISINARVNHQNYVGETPLHLAVVSWQEDALKITELLLDAGADTDIENIAGCTPLQNAALLEGIPGTIKLLAEKRPGCIDKKPRNGYTALFSAAAINNYAGVEELLEAGANPLITVHTEKTPWHVAQKNGFIQIEQLIRTTNKYFVKLAQLESNKQLYLAAKKGNLKAVQTLIADGANANYQDKKGMTALLWALKNGHLEVTMELLYRGRAAIDAADINGSTPLHYAAEQGFSGVVNLLFYALPAYLQAKNIDGDSPLHLAAKSGANEAVQTLISLGAEIDAENKSKQTPLYFAVTGNHPAVVQSLIEAGANINHADLAGITPLRLIKSSNDPQSIKGLLKKKFSKSANPKNLPIHKAFEALNLQQKPPFK